MKNKKIRKIRLEIPLKKKEKKWKIELKIVCERVVSDVASRFKTHKQTALFTVSAF